MNKQQSDEQMQLVCEVCDKPVELGTELYGCEKCGRMFAPCCNSVEDGLCVECV